MLGVDAAADVGVDVDADSDDAAGAADVCLAAALFTI